MIKIAQEWLFKETSLPLSLSSSPLSPCSIPAKGIGSLESELLGDAR